MIDKEFNGRSIKVAEDGDKSPVQNSVAILFFMGMDNITDVLEVSEDPTVWNWIRPWNASALARSLNVTTNAIEHGYNAAKIDINSKSGMGVKESKDELIKNLISNIKDLRKSHLNLCGEVQSNTTRIGKLESFTNIHKHTIEE